MDGDKSTNTKQVDYKAEATEARKKVLELIYKAQTSHIGSNFSCIDILTVLFEKIDLDKDKFILSAGWKAASLYYFLWKKGRITEDELNSYCQEGSKFIGLAEPFHKDIPFAGGSMGMGFPAAVGFALAKKLKGEEGKVYCLMSDGEMQCGTFWEARLLANKYQLDNLLVIVDFNGLQAMGNVIDILPLDVYNLIPFDGHNYEEIEATLKQHGIRPAVTTKGKGVSFMENNNLYHYKAPSEEEYLKAKEELHG